MTDERALGAYRPEPRSALTPVVDTLLSYGLDKSMDAEGQGGGVFHPIVRPERLSAGAFNADGILLAATPEFPTVQSHEYAGAAREVRGDRVHLVGIQGDRFQCIAAFARPSTAHGWSLPDNVRAVVETPGAALIGLSVASIRSRESISDACSILGLTALQARVLANLVAQGDLRLAARTSGVSYNTAREAMSEAMVRAGTGRRTALVDRVVGLAFGIVPDGMRGRDLLRDIWGLTPRQAAVALSVAEGTSRTDAARDHGLSDSVVKKEMKDIYAALNVTSAAELSAVLAEASSLAALLETTHGAFATPADVVEPLRLLARPHGGAVAYSDYGPRAGKPVLILHSSTASRPAPHRLVSELQGRGYRPFAMDRPGFGLTDEMGVSGDPFVLACDDIRTLCAHLRFRRIDVVARGGAQVALHLAAQSPELVDHVVLAAPDPPSRISRPTRGILGAIKSAFRSNVGVIEPLARMFVSNLRTQDLNKLMIKTIGESAPDLAVMQDKRNISDYSRGFQMFLAGKLRGYVAEQAAMVTSPDPPSPADHSRWTVFIGAHDPLHHPDEVQQYFRQLLPNAAFRMLDDGGRFIVMSHAREIVDALAQ